MKTAVPVAWAIDQSDNLAESKLFGASFLAALILAFARSGATTPLLRATLQKCRMSVLDQCELLFTAALVDQK
jgi:hypothetical protein